MPFRPYLSPASRGMGLGKWRSALQGQSIKTCLLAVAAAAAGEFEVWTSADSRRTGQVLILSIPPVHVDGGEQAA